MKTNAKLSKDIVKRLINPGITSISFIRGGEISDEYISNLYLIGYLASCARRRNLTAPKNNKPLNDLVEPIATAFKNNETAILDEEVIDAAEKWLKTFEGQLGRSSVANLMRLLDDMILGAGIREHFHEGR